jgi:hypothetical protein
MKADIVAYSNIPISLSVVFTVFVLLLLCLNCITGRAQHQRGTRNSEQHLERQIRAGEQGDLNGKVIHAAFLVELLKRHKPVEQAYPDIHIVNARISGPLEFQEMDVPFKLVLRDCIFDGDVNFARTSFKKDFSLRGGTFQGGANFYRIKVGGDLLINKVRFNSAKDINFDSVKVDGSASFYQSKFNGPFILSNSEMKALELTIFEE